MEKTNKEIHQNNTNNKDKYDFAKVNVFDINKARENTKKLNRSKMYDYAVKVAASINETIKTESEKGNSKCNVYINLKDIFDGAEFSAKDYSSLIDYITGIYSLKGYDISVYSSRQIIQSPIKQENIYLKVYIGWS